MHVRSVQLKITMIIGILTRFSPPFILIYNANSGLMLDLAQPTFHFYHKGEKASELVGVDVKKLEAAMQGPEVRTYFHLFL